MMDGLEMLSRAQKTSPQEGLAIRENLYDWAEQSLGVPKSLPPRRVLPAIVSGLLVFGSAGTPCFADYVPTGSPLSIERAPDSFKHSERRVVTIADRITRIRHYLSLNVAALSKVLRVERPTIYAWLKNTSSPQQANLERLLTLDRIAEQWRKLSNSPMGNLLRTPLEDGESLFQSMCKDNVSEVNVSQILQELDISRRDEAVQKKARYTSGKALAEKYGFSPKPERLFQGSLSVNTRSARLSDEE